MDSATWYVKTEDGKIYGPATEAQLLLWAQDGRIQPTGFLSQDRRSWQPSQLKESLAMEWLVEPKPGKVFGPFNRAFVSRLFKDGSAAPDAKVYRLHKLPVDEDPPPVVVEKIVEKIVEKEVRVEVPVEKIVEKEVRVEVPVEKIVEKIVEVEVPARHEIVVPEVVEPEGAEPPPSSPGSVFKGLDREKLVALEAAARRELEKGRQMGFGSRLFGGRR